MKRTFGVAFGFLALLFLLSSNLHSGFTTGQHTVELKPPSFVASVLADDTGTNGIGEKLEEEAGISAYIKSSSSIDLALIRVEFRTIEEETSDYIIGSVPFPNHPEKFDVHVYAHKDGWILAYYLKDDPASKIVDVKGRTLDKTKLRTTISTIAAVAGAPFSDVTYYDFRYPNATNMMIVAEDDQNGNDFSIQAPTEFGYFERSWAAFDSCSGDCGFSCYCSTFILDGGEQLEEALYRGSNMLYGTLTAAEFLPGETHTIKAVCEYGILVLTYRKP